MTLSVPPAAEHGWLSSRHTFSFADYYNPARMGFASLRVINEDWIEGGKGFGTHPHRDMEIITYMLDGELMHSEFNPSPSEQAHLLQVWILPEQQGLQSGYEQKLFPAEDKLNRWCLVGSRDGRDGSLTIHQDVNLYSARLAADAEIHFDLDVAMQQQVGFSLRAVDDAELLMFDLG